MKTFLNSKAKLIWFYWLIGFLSFSFLLMIILVFVVDYDVISNVFFGFGAVTLSILLLAYFSSKKTSYNKLRDKDEKMSDETVIAYLPNIKKISNDDIVKAKKKRTLYQVTWSLLTTSFSTIIALIFAYI